MLTGFSVENYKCFKDRITWNLDDAKDYTWNKDLVKGRCVQKGIILHEAGSDTDAFTSALFDITRHMTDKYAQTNSQIFLNPESDKGYAEFEYRFRFDGTDVIYTYRKTEYNRIIWERVMVGHTYATVYDEADETAFSVFHAKDMDYDAFKNSACCSYARCVAENISEKEDNEKLPAFLKFIDFSKRMLPHSPAGVYEIASMQKRISRGGLLKDYQAFLNRLGFDYKFDTKESEKEGKIICVFGKKGIDFQDVVTWELAILTDFFITYPEMYRSMFIVMQDIDAFHDSETSKALMRVLLSIPDTQIFMTLNNTGLITNDLLRPDCYFLLQNGNIDSFSNLTDKELRKAHNLEKMYTAGAFHK